MYQKALVTLDGSPLAELVLPLIGELARTTGVEEVVLLQVVEEESPEGTQAADKYLGEVGRTLVEMSSRNKPVSVSSFPLIEQTFIKAGSGDTARTILRFIEDNSINLVIMATHGRSGIDRWVLGSVADKVLRGTDVPVLLVRATENLPRPVSHLKNLLVPLDGSPTAEQVLPHVEQLLKMGNVSATLLHVAPDPNDDGIEWNVGPRHGGSNKEDTLAYLTSLSFGLMTKDAKVYSKVRCGNPYLQISQESADGGADLIIMSSHGHSGLAEWAFGTVAEKVIRSSSVPVLTIPASTSGFVPEHLRGPNDYRCHHCDRKTYVTDFNSKHRCSRCHYHLKACGNCVHFDGVSCLQQLADGLEVYPGNKCQQFAFRKSRLALR